MIQRQTSIWLFGGCAIGILGAVWWLVGVLSSTRSPSQEPQASTGTTPINVLEPGNPVEGTIRGGKIHAYGIEVPAGQYLKLVAEQQDVDLVVRLFDPAGQELIAVDSPNGRHGPEAASAVASIPGSYRFELRSQELADEVGRYRLRIDDLRAATATDRQRVDAETIYARGESLRRRGAAMALNQAIEHYEEALALWTELGDRAAAAWAHLRLGRVFRRLSRFDEALVSDERAHFLFVELGDVENQTRALSNIGLTYKNAGDLPMALTFYERALTAVQGKEHLPIEAGIFNNRGSVFASLGQPFKAIDQYDAALVRWLTLKDRGQQAITSTNIGELYSSLRETDHAQDYFEQALDLMRQVGNRRGEAKTLNNLGLLCERQGEYRCARDLYVEALVLLQEVGDRRGEALTRNNLGRIQRMLSETNAARVNHLAALRIARETKNRQTEALALADLGRLREFTGNSEGALDDYAVALDLFESLGDTQNRAKTLFAMSSALRGLGQLAAAQSHLEVALVSIEETRADVASPAFRSSYFATKHQLYESYMNILVERHRSEASGPYARLAFEASQRARARSLLDDLSENYSATEPQAHPELRAREKAFQSRLDSLENERRRLSLEGASTEDLVPRLREQRRLLAELEKARTRMRPKMSRRARPLDLEEIQRRILDPQTLLLNYELTPERSLLWAVTPSSLDLFELPGEAEMEGLVKPFHALLVKSHRRLAQQPLKKASAELGQILLGPVAAHLGTKRLVIAAEGILGLIPFAMLDDPAVEGDPQPLLARHEVVSLPAISALDPLRARRVTPSSGKLAVLADPVFQAEDPRVQGNPPAMVSGSLSGDLRLSAHAFDLERFSRIDASRTEAKAILDLVDPDKRLEALDFDASRETVQSGHLQDYEILHFATHSLVHPAHPELSGLVLSLVDEAGHRRDGFLRAYEISSLHLPAELVVLSACQTALGKEIQGEGTWGLTRAFMYAGARRVLVTLWKIDDRATAHLMSRFYEEMLIGQHSPPSALRVAQLAMLEEDRWNSPYHWAGFLLQGEWR